MQNTCFAFSRLALVATMLVACGGGDPAIEVSSGTVIRNATVVNTRDGSLLANQYIVVQGGKIENITAIEVRAIGAAREIDGSGKYVVPGFLDMHAHVMDAADASPPHWPLLIANGVTGVREMSGSSALMARAKKLNADAAAGLVDAPEILQLHGGFAAVPATAASGVEFVQQRKASGVDFVKISAGSPPFTLAVLSEAKAQGLTVAGHLVTGVSALASSNAGWHAVEHLGAGWGMFIDCATDEANIRQQALINGFAPPFPPTFTVNPRLYDITKNAPYYQAILNTFSDSKCQSLAQAFVINDTWHVPTLIRLRTQGFSDTALYRADPNLIYVDATRRALFEQLAQQYATTVPAAAAQTLRDFYAMQLRATKMMKQAGVKMMAGSDSANVAIWTIPGISLHQEFRELAAAGLSPLEILQMTTLNGAQFLKREATMGTVEKGKNGDLVLLDANPIADVANLDKIYAVVLKGKPFSKSALDVMKSGVAAAYANSTVQPFSAIMDPNHID